MRKWLARALALAAIMAGSPAAAEPPRPVSNTEIHALSDAELIKLVAEQAADFIDTAQWTPRQVAAFSRLTAVLGLEPGAAPRWIANQARERLADKLQILHFANEKKDPPTQPLHQIEVWTLPYAVATSGLCRSDILLLFYLSPPNGDASTPVTVNRLYVIPNYYALKPLTSPVAQPADAAEFKANKSLCSTIKSPKFIDVEGGDTEAVRGLWLLDRIEDGLKQKALPFALACDGTSAVKCRQSFAEDVKRPQIMACGDGAATCIVNVDGGFKVATLALEPGTVPKIRSISVQGQILVQDH